MENKAEVMRGKPNNCEMTPEIRDKDKQEVDSQAREGINGVNLECMMIEESKEGDQEIKGTGYEETEDDPGQQ